MASPNSVWLELSAGAWIADISGSQARDWLGDLVTGDIAGLTDGGGTRSLLLTPTGHIRADAWILRVTAERWIALQASDQPAQLADLLRPYILGSDVRITPIADPSDLPADLVPPKGAAWSIAPTPEAELDRIVRGIARFPVDLSTNSVPAEDPAALAAVDRTKGCFLGQESVAKIANLGHPSHVVRSFTCSDPVEPGEVVRDGTGEAGVVTSAARVPEGGTAVIARLRWAAGGPLTTASGQVLEPRTPVR